MPTSITRPVFVTGPPRSGTRLLFDLLSSSPALSPLHDAGGALAEEAGVGTAQRGWESHRLTAADATPAVKASIEAAHLQRLHHTEQRLLELSEHNALRVSFLAAVYPDARFVVVYRDPRFAMTAMLEAWRSGEAVTEPDLPGWSGLPWSMQLIPGWRELADRPLAEIVAAQWNTTMAALLDDVAPLRSDRWCAVHYEQLLRDPAKAVARVSAFLAIAPPLASTFTGEWRDVPDELAPHVASTAEFDARAQRLFARPAAPPPAAMPDPEAFRSVSTPNFSHILHDLGISLVVTTYQTGRVVLVRAPERGSLNTHIRMLPSPMGVAVGASLAIATQQEIVEYRNHGDLAMQLEPRGLHDAAWVPTQIHVTGAVSVHDLAWAGDELWGVNTLFSTLCTFDRRHSFLPRWQPPFITRLAAEDRCHLNGLAVERDRVRYATALGETDEPRGWRKNKAAGGVLMDVDDGRSVVRGLSMPHSPRLHDERLWVLESGRGTLATVDVERGSVETVAELPGFTRGLAFAGPFAFVGLSQVRESNVFGGIPLVERVRDRRCGVWVIDLRTAEVAAFLRFDGVVQEIFDVQVLHAMRHPELLELHDERVATSFVLPRSR